MALLLLRRSRTPGPGACLQPGLMTNCLALQRKVRIMKRTGTIIAQLGSVLKKGSWAQR